MNIITKQNGSNSVRNLRSDFDSLFDNFFNDFGIRLDNFSHSKTRVNISEDDKNYCVDAELPGVKKEDVSVEYINDILTIKAERKEEKKNYHRIESTYGVFQRSIQIPNIDYNDIKAKFEDGILKITLPKIEKSKTSIEIE